MRVSSIADNNPPEETRVRLDLFDPENGLDRGCRRGTEIAWYLVKWFFFLSPLPWPHRLKVFLLRRFGARVGEGVVIKPRVNIHLPWKLTVGKHAWIGEEVFLLNFEPVVIGDHACLSQRVFLCTGNHDYRDTCFKYRNAPINIGCGAWLGAQSFVGPGVSVGIDTVVTAGSVVSQNLPTGMVCSGNPCTPTKRRWRTATGEPPAGGPRSTTSPRSNLSPNEF
jgi:putative colanic acid biosynthesis acetyltransferase WcaF